MPDDLGESPFPEGNDHGDADEEFASVVFDEEFVRSARIHEPSAQERMLPAVQGRPEESSRAALVGMQDEESGPDGDDPDEGYPFGRVDDDYDAEWDEDDEDPYDSLSPARRRSTHARWHRTVAWVLAVIMGVGVVALTVAAVYRGASSGRQQPAPAPPGNSKIDAPAGSLSPLVAPSS